MVEIPDRRTVCRCDRHQAGRGVIPALTTGLPPLKDFLTLSGLIAAISVLLGSAIGIHSLRQPYMSKGRWLALTVYAALAILVSVGLLFNGAYQEQHSRDMARKIDTIGAILGSAPGISGEEVLNHIIGKFSQPQTISPPQMAKMAHEIASLKDILPKKVVIIKARVSPMPGYDNGMYGPLVEMLTRNGIDPEGGSYKPDSIDETGLLLIVKDPLNLPDYVTKFLSSLELADIRLRTY